MSVLHKKIGSVVDENFVYGRALHYLGIEFFENEHRSLDEVCKEKGISRQKVIKCFYDFDQNAKCTFSELEDYPIDLLLEYLRHSHHLFIKDKLPYISYLLCQYHNPLMGDLQVIFPDFVEDFIKHIYQEEDEIFDYIRTLSKIDQNRLVNPLVGLMKFSHFSLKEIRAEHSEEDEMANMRGLIDEIRPQDLHGKVILNELKAFDRELLYHAEIENEILFPRAINLENQIQSKLKALSQLN